MKIFRYITGFMILIFVQFLCMKFIQITGFNLPAPVLGIILLALLIELKIVQKSWIKDICELLMSNMPLLFIPLFVGIITYTSLIKENFISIAINILITTSLTLVISALFVENTIKFIRYKKIKEIKND